MGGSHGENLETYQVKGKGKEKKTENQRVYLKDENRTVKHGPGSRVLKKTSARRRKRRKKMNGKTRGR